MDKTFSVDKVEERVVEPICKPTEEICDGKDNDCDNQIDEGGFVELKNFLLILIIMEEVIPNIMGILFS